MGKQSHSSTLDLAILDVIKQTIAIRTTISLEMLAIFAMISKYVEPDGGVLLKGIKN